MHYVETDFFLLHLSRAHSAPAEDDKHKSKDQLLIIKNDWWLKMFDLMMWIMIINDVIHNNYKKI